MTEKAFIHELAQLKVLILDVDGVLTDGTLQYTETGELVKNFNAKDGLGIRMAMEEGIEVAIITARKSPSLYKRVSDLKLNYFYFGYNNKIEAYQELKETLGVIDAQIAYVGDDLLDIPVMELVGMPIAVADAHSCAKQVAKWVTRSNGGRGAVREVVDALLGVDGDLQGAYDRFLAKRVGKTKLENP